MIRRLLAVILLGSVLPRPSASGADSPDTSATLVVLRGCSIEFDRSSVLGAAVPGILKECLVRPGDRVQAKQVIGRLQDDDVRAELELKEAMVRTDIDVRLSKAKHASAVAKLRRSRELNLKRFISSEELDLHKLEADAAGLSVEEAEQHHQQAEFQRRQAEAAVHAREFVAPHDGIVVGAFKSEGEAVGNGDPVFRVVNTDRLRITGYLDVSDAWRVRKDQVVRVLPEIPGAELAVEREVFLGKIVFVDSQVDPETRTCKVTAEVDNRDNLLRAGLHARMEILPEVAPTSDVAPAANLSTRAEGAASKSPESAPVPRPAQEKDARPPVIGARRRDAALTPRPTSGER